MTKFLCRQLAKTRTGQRALIRIARYQRRIPPAEFNKRYSNAVVRINGIGGAFESMKQEMNQWLADYPKLAGNLSKAVVREECESYLLRMEKQAQNVSQKISETMDELKALLRATRDVIAPPAQKQKLRKNIVTGLRILKNVKEQLGKKQQLLKETGDQLAAHKN